MRKDQFLLSVRRENEILIRTVAHSRALYRALHSFRAPPDYHPTFPAGWSTDTGLSREWKAPSTNLDRRLICHNLEHAVQLSERRKVLAARYRQNLIGVRNIIVPPCSAVAMSHYTVRVPPEFRQQIRDSLFRMGIDTGRLFRNPGYLSEIEFPNATRLSSEVLNLPLDASLTNDDVDHISENLRTCVSAVCPRSVN